MPVQTFDPGKYSANYQPGLTYRSPDAGTYQQQLNQINPLISSGQYNNLGSQYQNAFDSFNRGQGSLEDVISAIKGSTPNNPSIGPQINMGQGNVPYTGQNLTQSPIVGVSQPTQQTQPTTQQYTVKPGDTVSAIAKQFGVPMTAISGYGTDANKIQPGQMLSVNNSAGQQALSKLQGTEVPASYAEASQKIAQASPITNQPEPQIASQLISTDPMLAQMQQQFQQFMSQQSQQQTLTQQYQDLLSSTGLQGINTQLVNMKNIMDGSENDIRTEVQKAGGFATESQVQALTAARNKTMLLNYNALLNQRNSIQDQVNTMMSLSQQDRQLASQQFDRMMNFEGKMLDYGIKMQDNARQAYQNAAKDAGYASLLTGNPAQDAITEQILGLPPGGLQKAATIELQKQSLDNQYKQAQINSLNQKTAGTTGGNEDTVNVMAQALLRGDIAPSQLPGFGQNSLRAKVLAVAYSMNPQFDATTAEQQFSFGKSTKTQGQLAMGRSALQTIDMATTNSDKIDRTDLTFLNGLVVGGKRALGDPQTATWITDINALADEIGTVLGQGSATDFKTQLGLVIADTSLSQTQFKASMTELTTLFKNRLNELLTQAGQQALPGTIDYTSVLDQLVGKMK